MMFDELLPSAKMPPIGKRSCVGVALIYVQSPDILQVSATWPDSVKHLASSLLREPVRILVGKDTLAANSRVEQS